MIPLQTFRSKNWLCQLTCLWYPLCSFQVSTMVHKIGWKQDRMEKLQIWWFIDSGIDINVILQLLNNTPRQRQSSDLELEIPQFDFARISSRFFALVFRVRNTTSFFLSRFADWYVIVHLSCFSCWKNDCIVDFCVGLLRTKSEIKKMNNWVSWVLYLKGWK